MELFKDSPLVAPENLGIVERGIDAYFNNDYMVACHLLIPQFENCIRRLVALCGGTVLRPNSKSPEDNEYISLEGLLDSQEAKDALGKDVDIYFKNVFTEHYGWNLRNQISHGLLTADRFNNTMADRVMHCFLLLAKLKFTNE